MLALFLNGDCVLAQVTQAQIDEYLSVYAPGTIRAEVVEVLPLGGVIPLPPVQAQREAA